MPDKTRKAESSQPGLAIPDHELIEVIGRGAYGEVWRARNIVGTERAVKIVRRAQFESERPYMREFVGIQKFEPISRSHDGFVDVLQIGRAPDDSYFYCVMELADDASSEKEKRKKGEREQIPSAPFPLFSPASYTPRTLRSELKSRSPLPVPEVIELGIVLCGALAHLHAHALVHRDVKPSNIIFVGGRPKLADIGLVAGVDEAKSFVGTEGYIPPEGPGSPQADLYSLGMVLYEVATGMDRHDFPQLPESFRGTNQAAIFAELNAVLLKACATDTRGRYPSADHFRADLELLQSGGSVKRRQSWQRGVKFAVRLSPALALVVLATWLPFLRSGKSGKQQPTNSPPPSVSASESFETSGTTNREAFNLYLLGREAKKNFHADGYLRAIRQFEQAVEKDPKFALAWAALGSCYGALDNLEHTALRICRPKARDAALKALALDNSIAEAHVVLGNYKMFFEWDWIGAEKEMHRAVELNPERAGSRNGLARLLAYTGRPGDGIREMREAIRLNPSDMSLKTGLGLMFLYAGQTDAAEAQIREHLEINPADANAHYQLAYVHWTRGNVDLALSEREKFFLLAQLSTGEDDLATAAYHRAGGGKPGLEAYAQFQLDGWTKWAKSRKPDEWVPPMGWVWGYMVAGDFDKAFEYYHRALDDRQHLALEAIVNPTYKLLWADPRFDEILKRTGLDKYFPERLHNSRSAGN